MDIGDWRNRISNRTDLVARLTHLTKGNTDDEAFENLWKIIMDKKLIASGNEAYIIGSKRAVCFQDVPLYSVVENLMYEDYLYEKNLQEGYTPKIRYSWFGLRFNKVHMYQAGARPVFYGNTDELKRMLEPDEYWRIVKMSLEGDNIVDWSHEREWRIEGDYSFSWNDMEILVKDDEYYRKFVKKCKEERKTKLLSEIRGVVPLNTVIS